MVSFVFPGCVELLPRSCKCSCLRLRSARYWFVERMTTLSVILIVIAEKFHFALRIKSLCWVRASTCRI